MEYNFRLPVKNSGKSMKGQNLPYPFLRGQPLNPPKSVQKHTS